MRKHPSLMRVALALTVAASLLLVAASAGAAASKVEAGPFSSTSFSGKVCSLLKSAQLKTVDVDPLCTPGKTAHIGVATIFGAFWGGPGNLADPKYMRLSVQVWKPNSTSFFARFKKTAQGTPVKIGTFGRADITYGGENLYFLAHGYAVAINLKHQAASTAENIGEIGGAMTAIGRSIAARL